MPQDRTLDRHNPNRRAVIWRPQTPGLIERLDAVVGKGKRGETLDRLVTAFLDSQPKP